MDIFSFGQTMEQSIQKILSGRSRGLWSFSDQGAIESGRSLEAISWKLGKVKVLNFIKNLPEIPKGEESYT